MSMSPKQHGLTEIGIWISSYIPRFLFAVIIRPCPNHNFHVVDVGAFLVIAPPPPLPQPPTQPHDPSITTY